MPEATAQSQVLRIGQLRTNPDPGPVFPTFCNEYIRKFYQTVDTDSGGKCTSNEPVTFGPNLILLERLAAGGMGEVYRAKQIGTGGFEKTVAVKRIIPIFAQRPEFASMFKREMNLCSRLQHPNIVQVFSNGQVGDYLYLVMEFVEGKTVNELISKTRAKGMRIPVEVSCYIVAEAAKGLQYAHHLRDEATGAHLGLVHRDISPQNIMVGYNGEVKVVDFGIAKAAAEGFDQGLTRTGDLKGKIPYLSPEQIHSVPLDGRSDIFSLGIVLYELLSGAMLFAGGNTFETLRNVSEARIPALTNAHRDIPPELELIVRKALSRDREERHQTAEELQRELLQLLGRCYPDFVSPDASRYLRTVFADEIAREAASRRSGNFDLQRIIGHSETELLSRSDIRVPQPSSRMSSVHMVRELTYRLRWVLIAFIALANLLVGMLIYRDYDRARSIIRPDRRPTLAAWVSPELPWNAAGREIERIWNGSAGFEQPIANQRPQVVPKMIQDRVGLSFDGMDDFLYLDSIVPKLKAAPAFTVAAVVRVRTDNAQYLWSVHGPDKNSDVFRIGFLNGGVRLKVNNVIGAYDDFPLPLSPRDFRIYVVTAAKDRVAFYQNGMLVRDSSLSAPVPIDAAGVSSIGQEYDGGYGSDYFQGDLAEFAIFTELFDEKTRIGLENYLANKFGIELTRRWHLF